MLLVGTVGTAVFSPATTMTPFRKSTRSAFEETPDVSTTSSTAASVSNTSTRGRHWPE
jgi:hypothetical protein